MDKRNSRWLARAGAHFLAPALLAGAACRAGENGPQLAAFVNDPDGNVNAMLNAPGDHVVLIFAGAGYTRVVAWAPLSVAPETLRAEMERGVAAAGLPRRPILSARQNGHTRAQWDLRRPRPLAVSGTATLRHGALLAAFRHGARPPHAALGHFKATHAVPDTPILSEAGARRWLDISAAEPGNATSFTARLSTPGWLLAMYLAGILMALLTMLYTGITAFRRAGAAPRARATEVLIVQYGAAILGAGILVAYVLLQHLKQQYVVADLWYGSASIAPVRYTAIGLILSACAIFIVLRLLQSILAGRARISPSEEQLSPEDLLSALSGKDRAALQKVLREKAAAVDAEEYALRTSLDRWKALISVAVIGLAAISRPVLKGTRWDWLSGLQWPLALLGLWIVNAAFKKRLAPYEIHTPDAELTKDAQKLGLRLGVMVQAAEVDDTWTGRTQMTASFQKGKLVMSRRVLREMTTAERDYVILRTLARAPMTRRATGGVAGLPVWALVAAGALAAFALVSGADLLRDHPLILAAFAAVVGAAIGGAVLCMRAGRAGLARLERLEADPAARDGALAKWRAAVDKMEEPADRPADDMPGRGAAAPAAMRDAAAPGRGLTLDEALRSPNSKGLSRLAKRIKR